MEIKFPCCSFSHLLSLTALVIIHHIIFIWVIICLMSNTPPPPPHIHWTKRTMSTRDRDHIWFSTSVHSTPSTVNITKKTMGSGSRQKQVWSWFFFFFFFLQWGGRAPTQLDTFDCIGQWLQNTKIQKDPLLGPNKRQYSPSEFIVLRAARRTGFFLHASGRRSMTVLSRATSEPSCMQWVDKTGQPHFNYLGATLKTQMWMAELL